MTGGFVICMVMCGSGVKTSVILEFFVSCAEVVGTVPRSSVVRRVARSLLLDSDMDTAASASAATKCRRNEGFAIIPTT